MKKGISICLLIYYSMGSLLFPFGNFSAMLDLPQMYFHCKNTEHHDMNPLDFITDHLINIDGIFDSHDDQDEQKPHQPFNFSHLAQPLYYHLPKPLECHFMSFIPISNWKKKGFCKDDQQFVSSYTVKIFHPPIV
jgi:hypothetical protein